MSDINVSFTGQANGAGALDALHLKLWGGEVMTAYNSATVFADKHMVREISSGKSATFAAIGKISAAYHAPGTELQAVPIPANERVITIDDLLTAQTFISNIDEAKNHYDVRGPYTEQLGAALAQTFDRNVAQVGILAARASATVTGQDAGTAITKANARTVGADMSAAIFEIAQKFDEKNVPSMGRNVFMLPAQYYLGAQTTALINKDWGGRGDIAKGTFESLAGMTIVKTNNLPQTNVTTGPTAYQGNFTNVAFFAMQGNAVGTLRLLSLALESEYLIRFQGTFMVAKQAVGHGILRPSHSAEVKVS